MNRTELIAATTAVLFVAFVLGWFVSWLMQRFTRVTQSELGELDHLAQQVHEAEEARDAAQTELRARERELKNRLAQTEAELKATMEVLREARSEVDILRDKLVEPTEIANAPEVTAKTDDEAEETKDEEGAEEKTA